ncbi:MAG: carbonic anhydrase [Candidatus Babeliales bacterium]|nr:carbonic anhydrase [Candidatus Babeliales bacterium]
MKKLIKGLHKFQKEVFPIQKNFFQGLAKGQNPEILFITCSDSRINPHLVTSADPGELFILRNAGNIIPPYSNLPTGEAATIEFAVGQLKVKDIIICGHSYCGAVEATFNLDKMVQQPILRDWLENNISPTLRLVNQNYKDLDRESLSDILLQEHVLQQLENLKTYPIINEAIAENKLVLHAWIYKFEDGDIYAYNSQEGQFENIKHY